MSLTLDTIKIAYDPVTHEVREGHGMHSDWLDRNFDRWARAIIYPKQRRIYFRFYKPDGDYYFTDDDDCVKSFEMAWEAREAFIKAGAIKKSWKVLYWDTDAIITPSEIRY